MIEIKDMSVHFKDTNIKALTGINVTLDRGEFVCVLGKSGAGKSTFIRTINGLQKPTTGTVFMDGVPISTMKEEEMRKVRREMGMIFQHFNLIPRLSVLQNVLTGTFGYRSSFKNLIGWFSSEEIENAKRVLGDVGLLDMAERRVETLSGGQKQRVGIARALLQQPRILLGDEPVASLDPGTSNHTFNILKEIHDRLGLLTIINVHDIELAKRYATRILAFQNGELIYDGTAEDFNEQQYMNTYGSEFQRSTFSK